MVKPLTPVMAQVILQVDRDKQINRAIALVFGAVGFLLWSWGAWTLMDLHTRNVGMRMDVLMANHDLSSNGEALVDGVSTLLWGLVGWLFIPTMTFLMAAFAVVLPLMAVMNARALKQLTKVLRQPGAIDAFQRFTLTLRVRNRDADNWAVFRVADDWHALNESLRMNAYQATWGHAETWFRLLSEVSEELGLVAEARRIHDPFRYQNAGATA